MTVIYLCSLPRLLMKGSVYCQNLLFIAVKSSRNMREFLYIFTFFIPWKLKCHRYQPTQWIFCINFKLLLRMRVLFTECCVKGLVLECSHCSFKEETVAGTISTQYPSRKLPERFSNNKLSLLCSVETLAVDSGRLRFLSSESLESQLCQNLSHKSIYSWATIQAVWGKFMFYTS